MINFIKRLFDNSAESMLHGSIAGIKFYEAEYRNVVIKGN